MSRVSISLKPSTALVNFNEQLSRFARFLTSSTIQLSISYFKMKSISIIVLCLCVALCYGQKAVPKPQTQNSSAKPGDKPQTATGYTTKYDNINLDEILSSKRLVKAYISCLLTGKGCSPEGNELRSEFHINFHSY